MYVIYIYYNTNVEDNTWKLGMTWVPAGTTYVKALLAAQKRIRQQDNASNPVPLLLKKIWIVPDYITDFKIRKELYIIGAKKTRTDKNITEWIVCTIDDISTAINKLWHGVPRVNSFPPRPEQMDCVNKTVDYFRRGKAQREFLINAKMRSGKIFMSYLIAKELKVKTVLVITYKPAAGPAWRADVENHVLFKDWYYSADRGFFINKKAPVNVIFASFQDLNDFDKPKWKGIFDHRFDLVIVDEMHYGSDTARAKLTLSKINAARFLYLSGTPLDAIVSCRFTEDNMYTWTYVDEQREKKRERLAQAGPFFYADMPGMEIHMFQICDEAKRIMSKYSADEQFTLTKFFASDDGKKFNDEAAVKLWLDTVFGRTVRKENSPVRTFPADHVLWSMPRCTKSVSAMCHLLKKIVGNEYHILNVSGNHITKLDRVKEAIAHHDKTITVTCGRFDTGVTVPEWDAVYMLNDGESPETYFQTIFRGQSPDGARGKEKCYVFDFNPQRTLTLLYLYAELMAGKKASVTTIIRDWLEYCPIIDHSGNSLRRVSTEEVIRLITDTGKFIDKYGSSFLFNKNNIYNIEELLVLEGGITCTKIKQTISDNGLPVGKNFKNKNIRSTTPQQAKDIENEYIEKAKLVTKNIPEYIMFVHQVKSAAELANTDSVNFEEHFGITRDLFRRMIDVGFLNVDRLDRLMLGIVT